MLKKIIPIVLVLCLICGISAAAENENIAAEETVAEISEQMPQSGAEPPQNGDNIGAPPSGTMQGQTPPSAPNGEMPREGMNKGQRPSGNFAPPQNGGNFTPPEGGFAPSQKGNTEFQMPSADGNVPSQQFQMPDGNQQFGGQMPGGMGGFPGNMQTLNGQTQDEVPAGFWGFVKTYATPITSVILLGLAFIFVIFYRRKNY